MKVTKQGDTYKVFSISEAAHNFLALELTDVAPERIAIEGHRMGTEEPSGIDAGELAQTVQKAMAKGNALFGLQLFPKRIQYVVSDTNDMTRYEVLAQEIMTAAANDRGARPPEKTGKAADLSPLPSS
jgi:hypothetical protein